MKNLTKFEKPHIFFNGQILAGDIKIVLTVLTLGPPEVLRALAHVEGQAVASVLAGRLADGLAIRHGGHILTGGQPRALLAH